MATTNVPAGTPLTASLNMKGNDILNVDENGLVSVSSNAQSVRFNGTTNGAVINNDGTIENTQSGGRAIRFETTVGATLNATINNNGTIKSDDDAIQIQAGSVTAGLVKIINDGTISSVVGQGIDFAGGIGSFVTNVENSGLISSEQDDAIRVGGVGQIVNTGTLIGGNGATLYAKADGIQFEDNTTGTVTNNGGTIIGDRHGINAGEGSQITVINNYDSSILGHNGSGVGSDGSATVINYGTITGSYTPGVDVNSPAGEDTTDGIFDGDGDGVDIDGKATIENFGVIRGTGASGHGSDGFANTAEGIAAGGGSIINHTGAVISGAGLGILIDNSSQGNAPFVTNIVNDGTIIGQSGTGIKIVSALDDTVANSGTIIGGDGNGILFGSGKNTLSMIGSSASVVGLVDGGAGIDTLDYSAFGRAATINLATGKASATGGATHFEYVVGSAFGDTITGDNGNNKLTGGAGDDIMSGGIGSDRFIGGAGHDTLTGGAGVDWFVYANIDAGAANTDTITDFKFSEGDRLDIVNIDGDVLTRGYQRFDFIGTAGFSGHAGEIRYEKVGGETHVLIDNTGDGVSDITINLTGNHDVTSGYFVV